MRKILLSLLLASTVLSASAQDDDNFIFNHLGVGVGIGTQGITIDAATMCTPYVGIRAGVNIMPKFSYSDDLELDARSDFGDAYTGGLGSDGLNRADYDIPDEVAVKGELTMTTGHVLFDIYPSKTSIFHLTVGAYFGGKKVINAYNKEDGALLDVYRWNSLQTNEANKVVAELGDYLLEPDSKGNVDANIRVNGFRPYLGIGIGRAVPKNRVGFQFDLGVQFWGSPKVYCNDEYLDPDKVGDGDGSGIVKVISDLKIYPTMSFRLSTRIL